MPVCVCNPSAVLPALSGDRIDSKVHETLPTSGRITPRYTPPGQQFPSLRAYPPLPWARRATRASPSVDSGSASVLHNTCTTAHVYRTRTATYTYTSACRCTSLYERN